MAKSSATLSLVLAQENRCAHCSFVDNDPLRLIRHVTNNHLLKLTRRGKNQSVSGLACSLCNKTAFASQEEYKKHLVNSHLRHQLFIQQQKLTVDIFGSSDIFSDIESQNEGEVEESTSNQQAVDVNVAPNSGQQEELNKFQVVEVGDNKTKLIVKIGFEPREETGLENIPNGPLEQQSPAKVDSDKGKTEKKVTETAVGSGIKHLLQVTYDTSNNPVSFVKL